MGNIFAQKKKNILEKGKKDPKIGPTEASSASSCVHANRSQLDSLIKNIIP